MTVADATDRSPEPLRVGLTGGVASGKSAVAERFAALGVPVLDTDVIARDVVAPGSEGLAGVRQAFGDEVIGADGQLDRGRLRQLVFSDPARRALLESIIHPLIRAALATAAASAGGPYQIHVIPLLVENHLQEQVDRVLVVDCPESIQIARLMARDGETRAGAQRILAAQASRSERLAAADDVIVNDGELAALDAEVNRLDGRYRRLAAGAESAAGAPVCRGSPADGQ